MQRPIQYTIQKNIFWLSADRCLYWEEEKALIVADLHFGKSGHFRKSGIAIPPTIFKEDLQRLVNCIQHFKPRQLIVIGDLFHSEANKELELFKKWRKDLVSLKIHLVKGNHDILEEDFYRDAGITIQEEELIIKDFSFCHDICDSRLMASEARQASGLFRQRSEASSRFYTFSGHIHPGIYINGAAKQSLRFPCFYFSKQYAVLPAFSRFTGTHLVEPEKGEAVFAVVNTGIVRVH